MGVNLVKLEDHLKTIESIPPHLLPGRHVTWLISQVRHLETVLEEICGNPHITLFDIRALALKALEGDEE